MKQLLLASLFFTSTFAFGEELSRREENQVIKCAMSIMESRQLDKDVVAEVESLFQNKLNENSLPHCKKIKKYSSKLEVLDDNDSIINLFPYDPSMSQHMSYVRNTLEYAAIGDLVCKVVGVEAQVQIGIGLGLGINLGKCVSKSGKVYGIVAPELVLGVGVGVYALADYTTFELSRNDPFQASDNSLDLVIGVGYAQSATMRSRDNYETTGYGIGLGMGIKFSAHIAIKLLPLGRTYKELRKNLLLDNVGQSLL